MRFKFMAIPLLLAWALVSFAPGLAAAAEKIKIGTALRTHAVYALPMLAAEEKGFWKEQGLDAEWVAFRGGAKQAQAAAAKAIQMGATGVTGTIRAITRKLPVVIVYHLGVPDDWGIWVRSDKPIKNPQDLKGKTIAVTRLAGSGFVYAKAMAEALGFGKNYKLMGAGGIRPQIASVKSGVADATMITLFAIAPLAVAGEVRKVLDMEDYLPKPWMSRVVYSHKDFLAQDPVSVGKMVKAMLQATKFIMKDRAWAIEKMETFSKYPPKAAQLLYPKLIYSEDGRIELKALENARQFLIDRKVVSPADTPPATQMYTSQFTG